jgi:copper resistance protein C
MRLPIVLMVSAILFQLSSGAVCAHAMLNHAEPSIGSKIASAPSRVYLRFTEKLEPAFSSVVATNASGRRIDSGKVRVNGNQMSIALSPGGTGVYHVTWHAVSVDTHTTDGNFTFQVGQ